jgi:hypothetical protein
MTVVRLTSLLPQSESPVQSVNNLIHSEPAPRARQSGARMRQDGGRLIDCHQKYSRIARKTRWISAPPL